MSRGLSAAAKAELYAANCEGVWLVLLTVTHSGISTLRYVNDRQNVTSGGDVYTALAFGAKLPADREDAPRAILVLDNSDRTVVAAIRSITSPATVTLEVIRRSDPDTILASWTNLQLVGARINAATVELELAPEPVLDEAYPGTTFTPLGFPAIFDR